jgi:hypothetical protein
MILVMPNIQLATIFQMVDTLCDYMHTPRMVATLVEDFQEVLFNQPLVSQIPISDISIDHLLVDLPIGPHVYGLHVGKIPVN